LMFVLALLLTSSCMPTTTSKSGIAPDPAPPTPLLVKAVYLTQAPGQLAADDLRAHPEVKVANSFDEFRQFTQTKVALWIDKNAAGLIPLRWLEDEPQRYDPLVLIGYNDTLYSFKYVLGICCFGGPIIDWGTKTIEPGFSIILRDKSDSPPFPKVIFLQGYNQAPSVQDILEVTNALMEGRLRPTVTPTFLPVASPTPVP
jgi:hypothetical protein